MLRHGDRHFGVTIHFMDEQFDTGDIAAQAEVDLPDGVSGEEADTLLVAIWRRMPGGSADRARHGHARRGSRNRQAAVTFLRHKIKTS